MSRLIHIGSTLIDYIYRVAALPGAGGESVASAYRQAPGGGYNTLLAAARTGLAVAYGGPHGAGPNGDALRRAFAAAGIATLQAPSPLADTGNCVVLITPDAQRTFVSHAGIEGAAGVPFPDPAIFGESDWIVLTGYLLHYPGSAAAIPGWLEALPPDVPVVFDPSPIVADIDPAILARALRRTTWLSCNRDEAALIAGSGPLLDHCPAAAGLVVRDGANGCFVQSRGGDARHVPGFAVSPVDTNGAGDVHIGAFVSALARGSSAPDAARYANAAAAIAISRSGGGSAPADAEIQALLAAAVG